MGKNSLRKVMILLLCVSSIIPLLVTTTFTYISQNQIFKKDFNVLISDNLSQITSTIKGMYNTNVDSIEMLAIDPNAQAILREANSAKWLLGSLKGFVNTHKEVTRAYMVTATGETIITSEEKLSEVADPRENFWYKEAMSKNGQIIVTDPYEDILQKGTYIVTFAKGVKDPESGQTTGVIGLDIRLDKISNIIQEKKIGEKGYAILIDKSGRVIGSKDKDIIYKSSKDLKWLEKLTSNKNNIYEEKINDKDYLIYSIGENATGWTAAGLIPKEDLTTRANRGRNSILLISIVALVICLISGNVFYRIIDRSIKRIEKILNKMKNGDFTEKIKKEKGIVSELGRIIDSINALQGQMAIILGKVSEVSGNIRSSSTLLKDISQQSNKAGEDMARAVQEIAAGSSSQASSTDREQELIIGLGNEVKDSLIIADNMVKLSKEVKESTDKGINIVKNLSEQFVLVSKSSKEVSEKIKELADKSNEIGKITETIGAITEQTNLLALNASIEAARAGEAGRGFAVVADEVRKLAEQSAASALQINNVIVEIKENVVQLFSKIESTMVLNKATGESVNTTKEAFSYIAGAIMKLTESMENTSASLTRINNNKDIVISKIKEVSSLSEEIASSTEEVSASTEQQSAGLQEVVKAAKNLEELSNALSILVEKFKI